MSNDTIITAEAAVQLADRGHASIAESIRYAAVRGEDTASLTADLAAAEIVLVVAQAAARDARAAAVGE